MQLNLALLYQAPALDPVSYLATLSLKVMHVEGASGAPPFHYSGSLCGHGGTLASILGEEMEKTSGIYTRPDSDSKLNGFIGFASHLLRPRAKQGVSVLAERQGDSR